MVDVPLPVYRDQKLSQIVPEDALATRLGPNATWMLYTGADRELADRLQEGLLYRSRPFYVSAFSEVNRNAAALNGGGNFSRDSPDFDVHFAKYVETLFFLPLLLSRPPLLTLETFNFAPFPSTNKPPAVSR